MSEIPEELSGTGLDERTGEKKSRKRLRLSCLECRKKKLFCDRNSPCQRCIKAGRPERCSFETNITGQPSTLNPSIRQQEQIRDLQVEVSELKALLLKVRPVFEGDGSNELPHGRDRPRSGHVELISGSVAQGSQSFPSTKSTAETPPVNYPIPSRPILVEVRNQAHVSCIKLADPRDRSPRGYYHKHSIFQFFGEIPELFPFIREIADEWFKPLGVHLSRNKATRKDNYVNTQPQNGMALETLLPPRHDTDALVSFYLDHLEQLHRVVHIPTFRREYDSYWIPGRARHPAMTVIILAMISISACASASFPSVPGTYRTMPLQWISACEEWLKQQSTKHRKIVHYQVACLVYLSKRINMIGKKRFWKETGSLMQDAIIDGLYCIAATVNDSPYIKEMKTRIWATLRELDLQNSFETGLPILLHNVHPTISPPANLDDEDFDEKSKELPEGKPLTKHTFTSYQAHSARSWTLRLEISRHLFSSQYTKPLSYEEVLRYTHEVTQAIDSIPSCDTTDDMREEDSPRFSALTYGYLCFQLKECLIALHRPYLNRNDGKFWLSETVFYQTSRDILDMSLKLKGLGLQYLTGLREDLMVASLGLCRISILQPKGSTSVITDNQSSVDLFEQCLSLIEDRYLACCHDEPWCVLSMYAAFSLFKMHVRKEPRQDAKAACARKFLDLHYRYKMRPEIPTSNNQYPTQVAPVANPDGAITSQLLPIVDATLDASEWLDTCDMELDFDFEAFDFDLGLESNNWDGTDQLWSS